MDRELKGASGAALLRSCARLLRLPSRAIITALSYYHEYERSPIILDSSDEPWMVVAACIFLASKVEEVSLSNNHLINVVRFVSTYLSPPYLDHGVFARDEATGSTEAALTPEISALIKDSDMIVGQQYYDAKAKLLAMEQHILRAIRFKMALIESQPYTYLFSVLKAIQAKPGLVDASISVMNDVAAFSTLMIDTPPLQLSVACVHVASHLLDGVDVRSGAMPGGASAGDAEAADVRWHDAIGVTQAGVEMVGHKILDALSSASPVVPSAVSQCVDHDKG